MKKYFMMLLLIGQLALVTVSYSQNIAINGTGSLPDTSAMLDVSSTIKGFLAPRITTTQQNAIPLPAKGLLVYNTADNVFRVNTGTTTAPVWATLSTGATDGTVKSVGLTSSDITVSGASPITGSGSYTLSLPTINTDAGTYTNATITVNAKGLVTAASSGSAGGGSSGNGWSLSGNNSTGPNNYVGTKDGQPLTFKVNGTQAGYLGLSGSSFATSFGVGSNAGFKSTAIGASTNANSGNEAVAVGFGSTATGYRSIAIGSAAQGTTQNDVIAIGTGAIADSYQGIAMGAGAKASLNNSTLAIGVGSTAKGYQSTAIGAGSNAAGLNSTAIGNGASATNDNLVSIGNTAVTLIRGQVNFTTYSDGRFKRNIHTDVPGLDFILNLRPVSYNWDIHKFNQHNLGNEIKAIPAGYSPGNEQEEAAILKKESIVYTGFIAQEVEKAAQDANFNFSGVLKPQNTRDAYSLSYAEFVVPLVKAAQELNEKNEALNKKIDAQQKLIEQLMQEVNQIKKKHK
ncbi:MAG: tail fiber domain-containing protein [Ferruginibacter sp.]